MCSISFWFFGTFFTFTLMFIHTYDPLNSVSPSFSLVTYFLYFVFTFMFCLILLGKLQHRKFSQKTPLLPNVFSMLDAKRMYDVLVSSFSIFFKNDDSKMLLGQILTVFDSEKTLTKTFYFAPRVTYFLSRVTATLLI